MPVAAKASEAVPETYYYIDGPQFWMFTIYDKDEATDLTKEQKKALKKMPDKEVAERSQL